MIAIAAVLAAPPAMAAAADKSTALEEVVVTARKVSENLQNVPVAVTAFTGADLQDDAARHVDGMDLEDVLGQINPDSGNLLHGRCSSDGAV